VGRLFREASLSLYLPIQLRLRGASGLIAAMVVVGRGRARVVGERRRRRFGSPLTLVSAVQRPVEERKGGGDDERRCRKGLAQPAGPLRDRDGGRLSPSPAYSTPPSVAPRCRHPKIPEIYLQNLRRVQRLASAERKSDGEIRGEMGRARGADLEGVAGLRLR
jgi:hypothetical protein